MKLKNDGSKKIKCLFLACSGVRIKSDELRKIGVTLPGFVERGKVIASLPSLGLLTLAAHTPENWDIAYLETREISADKIVALGFDVVAISSLSAQIDIAYEYADQLKEAGLHVVLGGLHVSGLPEEALLHASSIVIGEGELAWEKFCEDFENLKSKSIYLASDYGPFDFKNSKVPRYDLLKMDDYNRITVQTQRGCPRKCIFCSSSHTISAFKVKPVELIIKEIEAISQHWPHPFIEFADDNTFINRKWAKDLMKALAPLNIRWFTETDLSVAEDDVLLEWMSVAGCYQILIGLESANVSGMKDIDPVGWKLNQFKKYKKSIEKIQSYGISVNGCFIVGLDSDDQTCFEKTKQTIEELELAEVQITVLTPFPNTVLYQQFKKEGRLIQDKFWDSCTLFDVNYFPKQMSVKDLQGGLIQLFEGVYSEDSTKKRHDHFIQCVKNKHELKRKKTHSLGKRIETELFNSNSAPTIRESFSQR